MDKLTTTQFCTSSETALNDFKSSGGVNVYGPKSITEKGVDGISVPPLFGTNNNAILIDVHKGGMIKDMNLEIGLTLSGGTIGTGTFKCFRQAIAYSMFKEIRLRQGQNTKRTYNPEQIYDYVMLHNTGDELKHIKKNIGHLQQGIESDTTDVSRAYRSKVADYRYKLNMDEFCQLFQKPFPNFLINSNDPLYWEFDIYDQGHLIETNYQTTTGITATITYFKLITTYIYPPKSVIDHIVNSRVGKTYYKLTCEPVTRLVSMGTTETFKEEKMTELHNRNVVMVTMKLSKTDNTNSFSSDDRFGNFIVIDRWAIKDDTKYLSNEDRMTTKERFRSEYVEGIYEQANYIDMPDINVFYTAYCDKMYQSFEDFGSWSGSKYFDSTIDKEPVVRIEKDSAPSALSDLRITVYYMTKMKITPEGMLEQCKDV